MDEYDTCRKSILDSRSRSLGIYYIFENYKN